MKIAIVTINLNNKTGLERTIQSVISQTYKDYQYIIIDGDSTDGSKEIINQYKNQLTYCVSEPDKGIYNAMNKALPCITAEYTLFLNSGDFLHTNTILTDIVQYLNEDIVYGDLLIHETNGDTFTKQYDKTPTEEYFLNDTLPHQASFIKTTLIQQYPYREDYNIISDWIFFYETITKHKATYKHIPTIIADFHLGGISSDTIMLREEKYKYYNE